MPTETIKVFYKPIDPAYPYYYHKYLIYTDSTGERYYARGGPSENGIDGFRDASAAQSGSGSGGTIETDYGLYRELTPDWDPTGTRPGEIIIEGGDLSAYWRGIEDAMDAIENENYVYRPFTQNSNTTVDEALARNGLPQPETDEVLLSPGSGNTLPGGDDIQHGVFDVVAGIFESIRLWFDRSTRESPIVLDLDGDGVETTALRHTAFFDYAGDGFAESTAWAAPDDGLLVWDRNSDGKILRGAELFGNYTPLVSGGLASNGFVALAELDANADGKVDANDPRFANLQIWRDINRDQFVSPGELQSLSAAGVKSINTAYLNSTFVDSNGNAHSQVGTFSLSDGSSRAMADVWFKTDALYAYELDWRPVPVAVQSLPDLQGAGVVRSLHQAITRDSSGVLQQLLVAFVSDPDPVSRSTTFERMLFAWAGVESIELDSRGAFLDARRLGVLEKFLAETHPLSQLMSLASDSAMTAYHKLFEVQYAQLSIQTNVSSLWKAIDVSRNASTQSYSGSLEHVSSILEGTIATNPAEGERQLAEFARVLRGLQLQDMVDYAGFRSHFVAIDDSFAQVFDQEVWVGTDDGEYLRGASGNDRLLANGGNDRVEGGAGADMLDGGAGDDFLNGEWDNDTLAGAAGNDTLIGGNGEDVLNGGTGNDALYGNAGNDVYQFGRGSGQDTVGDLDHAAGTETDVVLFDAGIAPSDVAVRREGNALVLSIQATTDLLRIDQQFRGAAGPTGRVLDEARFADGTVWNAETLKLKTLTGTAGDDFLAGYSGNDVIEGLAGADTLLGDYGNDLLRGGDGNDTLSGGDGEDVLNGGTGNDALYGNAGSDLYQFGRGSGQDTVADLDHAAGTETDVVLFDAGIAPSDVAVRREGNALVLSIQATTDLLRIDQQFRGAAGPTGRVLDEARFADGTVWNAETLKLKTLIGTAAAETIFGTDGADVIDGAGGDDVLYGLGGDDMIKGGSGANTLVGGLGNDTYVLDQATDIVVENTGEGVDTIQTGVAYTLGVNIENLTLTGGAAINGTGNALQNVLTGNAGNNELIAGAGNDTLNGGAANDVLEGGADADTLYGGSGLDTARYSAARSAYTVTKSGTTFTVAGPDGTDTLTGIERLQFSDALISLTPSRVDTDGNGSADVLWRDASGGLMLWQMSGIQPAVGVSLDSVGLDYSIVDAHGDYDGDGSSDILWRNNDGSLATWEMHAAQAIGRSIGNPGTAWNLLSGHADFTGDGRSDLLFRHNDGSIALWEMQGAQPYGRSVGALALSWSVLDSNGDYDGDGRYDLLLRHLDGTVAIWRVGVPSAAMEVVGALTTSYTVVDGHADFNYDGRSDLLLRDTSGNVATWEMQGAQHAGYDVGFLSAGWSVVSAHGDYDGNGKSDLLLRYTDGQVATWEMQGGALVYGQAVATLPGNWKILDASSDYTADGRSDLLLRDDTGAVAVWEMQGAQAYGRSAGALGTGFTPVDTTETGAWLNGGGANNTLVGTVGRDRISGWGGNDTLTGGAGDDRFVFDTMLNASSNVDTITDFTSGSDALLLNQVIFPALPPGLVAAASFVAEAGAVAHDANDFILYDTVTGNVAYDADGSGAQAAVVFATLMNHPLLRAPDVQVGWL